MGLKLLLYAVFFLCSFSFSFRQLGPRFGLRMRADLPPSSIDVLAPRYRYRYASRVAYDGTSFKGWQDVQDAKLRTIQGTLNDALSRRFNTSVKVTGASRTDKGVHSRGQVLYVKNNIYSTQLMPLPP